MSPSLLRQSVRPALRSTRQAKPSTRFSSTSSGSNPQVEAAQKKAQEALASAQQTAGKFLGSAKKFAGPVSEKAGSLLGSYRQPVVYNLSVFRELCKQIYKAEGLAPPSVATVRSAYQTMWSRASSREFWQGAIKSGEIARIGVYAVEASVPSKKLTDPELEMLSPAITGTTNVLKAASAANVRRVVVVSSMVAVEINPKDWPKDKIKDENCWSDKEFCRNNEDWYSVSKITAEEAALEYGRQTGLDVVTVNPALVFGPLLQPMLNTSCQFLVYFLKGGPDQMRNKLWHIVDVRDTADALLLVYEAPEASGRHICAPHFISARDLLDLVKSMYPDYPFMRKESICDMDHPAPMTSDKLKKLGWSCRPLKETIADTVEFCKQAGFLEDVEGAPCRFPPLYNKI